MYNGYNGLIPESMTDSVNRKIYTPSRTFVIGITGLFRIDSVNKKNIHTNSDIYNRYNGLIPDSMIDSVKRKIYTPFLCPWWFYL